jgi:hypothetical protein
VSAPEYPGVRLTLGNELLRRVAPLGKSKGAVVSTPAAEAFKPDPPVAAFKPGGRNSRDNGGLSTKRAITDPEAVYWAYLHSAKEPGSRVALGTWGFKVCEADSLDLPSFDDGGIDDDHPENHATVWFPMPTELSTKKLKLLHDRIAEDLRNFALVHGCLFRPNDPEADARSLQATAR